jgi:hypothetical protein
MPKKSLSCRASRSQTIKDIIRAMSHASCRNLALGNNVMTGRMKPYQLLPLLLILLLLTACGAVGDEIVFAAAPWQDGETSEYDVISAQGDRAGTAVWQWRATPTGWQQTYTVTLPSRVDSGVMLLGHDLLPQTSDMERGGAAYATTVDLPYVQQSQAADSKLLLSLDDPEQHNPDLIRRLVNAGAEIQFVGEARRTLEEIYLQLVQEEEVSNGQN